MRETCPSDWILMYTAFSKNGTSFLNFPGSAIQNARVLASTCRDKGVRKNVCSSYRNQVPVAVFGTLHLQPGQSAAGGQPSSVRTRGERLQVETEEVQVLRARLECTELNLRELAKVAEYVHGAAQKVLYRTELVTELRSVEKQVEVLKKTHEDDDTVTALQD
eukprot:6039792-Amphidinium_carterae.1